MLRVIQLVDHFGSGGGLERFVYNLSGKLEDAGHETVIVSLSPASQHKWGQNTYDQVHLTHGNGSWGTSIAGLSPDLILWHGTPGFIPLIHDVSTRYPTLATVHGVMCPSGSRLLVNSDHICVRKSGLGCLLLWYTSQCGYGKSPSSAISALNTHSLMVKALKRCRRVYAVSESVKRFLVVEGIQEDAVHVFDNTLGMTREAKSIDDKHLGGTSRPLKLLYVGRLVYVKGVQYLLRTLHEMIKEGQDVTCTIAGEGSYRVALHRLAQGLGVEKYVTFLGEVSGEDIKKVYEDSDIVVVPSIWPEPAGLVVPEARAVGKPVVVANAGGLAEWAFLDNVFLAEPASTNSLKRVIERVAYAIPDDQNIVASSGQSGEPSPRIDLIVELKRLGMNTLK